MIHPKVREYVRQVIQKSVTICGAHLPSVVLFGSAAREQFSEGVSDVDLILVVSDDTPNQVVRKLDTELERFEATKGPMKHRSHFLKVFAYKTALFRSHFVVKDGALRSLDTRRLFNQGGGFSLPLGRLLFSLAPADLVLRNVLRGAVVVHGENVISSLRLPDPTYSFSTRPQPAHWFHKWHCPTTRSKKPQRPENFKSVHPPTSTPPA